MTEPRQIGIARCHDEVVDLIRARKDELGLSDQFVDEIGGLTCGHTSKILGPSRAKTLGRFTMDVLLEVHAVSFIVVVDEEKLARMQPRYEGRENRRVHFPKGRISKLAMARAKPIIYREAGRQGGLNRAACLPAKQRSDIARKAALKRWRTPKVIEIAAPQTANNPAPDLRRKPARRRRSRKPSPPKAMTAAHAPSP